MTLVKKIKKNIINLKLVIQLEYQNKSIFAEGYTPIWSEEVFMIKKVKRTVPWTYAIIDLNGEKIAEPFYKKE